MPEVKKIAELVQVQKASIVSQTLIDRPAGTVTLFAFDAGQALSEHTAPFDAMVQVLEGSAEIRISGRPYTLGAGETIVMPGGEPHALRALTPFKMMLTMIKSR